ncbi:prephenate dehydrogenase/arogenate dehydrogenase family protein [Novacetimonas pomaceti]|uniref:prephenate dehydrogenase n=1 Tax=Novacetimonas pomaceti TaxID=2021998 RepID=A0A318QJ43_9PROT|nr:prephenate dehydrogenase/arogenate dehydrogenase family protein [Novacetimonas pomaceti]PYD75369.1 cyclohexadienyl dehydrogenase [Novacetimonas pomaceti]
MTATTPFTPLFDRLVIIGPGLIGSSILRRAHENRAIARELVASDIDAGVCARVRELGIADRVEADPARAVVGADCVILCVPVGAIGAVAAQVVPAMKHGAILSEVGSTKVSVINGVLPALASRPDIAFVPSHPMAGTEYSGPDAGFPSLFENRWCLLTPPEGTPHDAVARITALWQAMGAHIRTMTAEHHDRVCAIVSHLPHLLAFTICGTADDLAGETRSEVLDFAASGFRDFTRIAASDPTMWRDIFLNNREALLEMLDRFMADAHAMAKAIREGDDTVIVNRITRGRAIRRTLIENRQA